MTATQTTEIEAAPLTYDEWEKLDRQTQIHIAEYDSGDFRILYTFTSDEMRLDRDTNRWRPARVTWSSCEELIDGRWEGFVSTTSVAWK